MKLEHSFGAVRIYNPGVMQELVHTFPGHRGINQDQFQVVEPGEYYVVCCPFCGDAKFRLYINHMFGVREPVTGSRRLHLAHCFNEDCVHDYESQMLLVQQIEATPDELAGFDRVIRTGVKFVAELERATLPGKVTPVNELAADHIAVRYLQSRGFDLDYLAKFYRVGWCNNAMYQLASGRIIIPVFKEGVLKGWQARYPGEMNWKRKGAPPKYFTMPGMPRRHVLYNFGRACQYRTIVLVEGVTDVWRFGAMAVCTFGDTLTPMQRQQLVKDCRDYNLVVLYDPEAMVKPNIQEMLESLKTTWRGGAAAAIGVTLPDGTDPGSLSREFLRAYVEREAEKQGVHLSWQRR